jgi:hypothetical protein
MYNNKTILSGVGPVVPFLFASTNLVRAYGSWVVGMIIYNMWELCGLFLWSLWKISCLSILGRFLMQPLNLNWSSEYICPRPNVCLGLCRRMLCVLVASSEMIMVFDG